MAKTRAATNTEVDSGQEFVYHKDLNFDLENPRFIGQIFKDEKEIIKYLYDAVEVDELIQSILSAGWVDFEPFIVLRTAKVVLEGNRRLAALRLITREDIRNELGIRLPTIPDAKAPPDKVRARWVTKRSDARGFIGFKHIKGPLKWDAMAKARYAATRSRNADFLELSAALSPRGVSSKSTLTSFFRLLEGERSDEVTGGDTDTDDAVDQNILEQRRETLVSITFDELSYREKCLGDSYPFTVDSATGTVMFHANDAIQNTGNVVYSLVFK